MSKPITPRDQQICIVQLKDGSREYAVWTTNYSIYGSGGHFQLGSHGMLGLPVDVDAWWGTHWIATETPGIAIDGQATIAAKKPSGACSGDGRAG